MGQGSYFTSLSGTRSSSRFSRYNSDVQRFLDHPKPKSWLTALADHPALTANKEDEETKISLCKAPTKDIHEQTISNVVKELPIEVKAIVLPKKHEDIAEENEKVPDYYETVYEKHEVVNAIEQWIEKIFDHSQYPWEEHEYKENALLLDSAERLDPFHNFDWNSGRSHTGRLIKLLSGRYNNQGRLHGRVDLVFSSGEEISGVFYQGRRQGKCTIKSVNKGIRYLNEGNVKMYGNLSKLF